MRLAVCRRTCFCGKRSINTADAASVPRGCDALISCGKPFEVGGEQLKGFAPVPIGLDCGRCATVLCLQPIKFCSSQVRRRRTTPMRHSSNLCRSLSGLRVSGPASQMYAVVSGMIPSATNWPVDVWSRVIGEERGQALPPCPPRCMILWVKSAETAPRPLIPNP